MIPGLLIMIVSECATLARIEPFYSWNTPICWTGFILFADSVVYRACARSRLRSEPFEFALLALFSIPLWLVFEGYNLLLRNWYYTGLPQNFWLRMFGYAWSYSTIWPAIFEGADLVWVWTGPRPRNPVGRTGSAHVSYPAFPVLLTGAAMLALPFVVSRAAAQYLAAPVWLGFILLLDPINRWLGGPSLADDLNLTADFLLSGLLCGVLWEFWNYWAGAKWHYAVPIMKNVKIFEMPLPGYLGFPPFALECFTMFVFVRLMFRKHAS